MAGIVARDRQAFARFYDRFSSPVFSYCLRALRDRADAEDLLLDIFAEFWDRADRYDAALSQPFTYLMNLTRVRLIDRLRRRGTRERQIKSRSSNGAASTEVENVAASTQTPLAGVELSDERACVRRAMNELSPDQRTVVEMAFFDAFTHAEIAQQLDVPLGTIKSRIRQALGRLRDSLSDHRT